MDDILRFVEDADALIEALKSVLAISREKYLKLNPRECDMIATKAALFTRKASPSPLATMKLLLQ